MLEDGDLSFPKVFVTGIYGSGKTTAAIRISKIAALPYKAFDASWNYKRKDRAHAHENLTRLGPQFVTDAIAFSADPDPYFSFNQFYIAHPGEVLILCVTCLDIAEWMRRLRTKPAAPRAPMAMKNFVGFHTSKVPLHQNKNIRYYDTASKAYVTAPDISAYIETIS